jgi:hypothetical protein
MRLDEERLHYVGLQIIMQAVFGILMVCIWARNCPAADVTLAWDPPTTNTDGTPLTDIGGYRLKRGAVSGIYTQSYDVGTQLVCTVTGLPNATIAWTGTNYVLTYTPTAWTLTWSAAGAIAPTNYFAVLAYNQAGRESDLSQELPWSAAAAVTNALYWGTTQTGCSNLLATGLQATNGILRYDAPVTAFPRSTIWLRPMANGLAYPQSVLLNNRKPAAPTALRLP